MARSISKTTAKSKTTKPAAKSSANKSAIASTGQKPRDAVVIQMIPLNQLQLSPKNVRKVKASQNDDAELLASIRENGVKQNLAGYEGANGGYLIDAGGRRLKALHQLASEGAIPKDHPVACLIEDESEATITSTTENMQRAAMHPADQFEAFNQMITEGRSEDEIAIKFGVSVDLVRRRLKLARVAPEILDQFREDELSLECVMAFTLSDNHDRQLTVWNAIKDSYSVQPHSIRRLLTETGYSASSKLGRFVGVEAYEKAGGTVITDLFSEHDNTHLENPELLERLAMEKLQEASTSFVRDWKWVDVHFELDHSAFRSFGRIEAEEIEPDPTLTRELETLNAREDELHELNQDRDWSDEERKEYHSINPRISQIETEIEDARPYAQEDRVIAGVVITIGHQGDLKVEKGLVRPEDIPAPDPEAETNENDDAPAPQVISPTSSAPVPISDPAAALRKVEGISASLADDLRTTRHHILRAHLAADYDVAYDAMLYTLCQKALHGSHGRDVLDISLNPYYAKNRDELVADSVAEKMLDALKNDLAVEWMELETPEDFRVLSDLPVAHKQALFAWATALALKAQMSSDNYPSKVIEEIGTRLDVDVAVCWRPTASKYWSRVNKAHAVKVSKELISDEFAEDRSRERKSDLAAVMERAFAENAAESEGFDAATAGMTTRWLPEGMAFEETNNIDADLGDDHGEGDQAANSDVDDADHDDAGANALPAFLNEATA